MQLNYKLIALALFGSFIFHAAQAQTSITAAEAYKRAQDSVWISSAKGEEERPGDLTSAPVEPVDCSASTTCNGEKISCDVTGEYSECTSTKNSFVSCISSGQSCIISCDDATKPCEKS